MTSPASQSASVTVDIGHIQDLIALDELQVVGARQHLVGAYGAMLVTHRPDQAVIIVVELDSDVAQPGTSQVNCQSLAGISDRAGLAVAVQVIRRVEHFGAFDQNHIVSSFQHVVVPRSAVLVAHRPDELSVGGLQLDSDIAQPGAAQVNAQVGNDIARVAIAGAVDDWAHPAT